MENRVIIEKEREREKSTADRGTWRNSVTLKGKRKKGERESEIEREGEKEREERKREIIDVFTWLPSTDKRTILPDDSVFFPVVSY